MKDIIVEIKSGVVMDIYSDIKDARVIIVDWDRAAAGDIAGYTHRQTSLGRLPIGVKKEYRRIV